MYTNESSDQREGSRVDYVPLYTCTHTCTSLVRADLVAEIILLTLFMSCIPAHMIIKVNHAPLGQFKHAVAP